MNVCLSLSWRGDQVPQFGLEIDLELLRLAELLAGAAQAFKGGSEGLVYHTKLRSAAAARDRVLGRALLRMSKLGS